MTDMLDEPATNLVPQEGGGGDILSETGAIVQSQGCTLEAYAEAKKLPIGFLKSLGVSEFHMHGTPALRIPYFNELNEEKSTRQRIALHKAPFGQDNRFRWKAGSKSFLYGINRLDKSKNYVVLVEGESDCHTLWYHNINALGLPGASQSNEKRDAPYFASFDKIYVVLEPDAGGDAVMKWISKSSIKERVIFISLVAFQCKDPSELHVLDPAAFAVRWTEAVEMACSWDFLARKTAECEKVSLAEKCRHLAHAPDILELFVDTVRKKGLVGEDRNAQILYLALTSRLLAKPVSVAVKGSSSGGKSFTVESVLAFFPQSAYYARTSMTDRALAYTDEVLKHRFIVLFEASGMESDCAQYIMRSLLSEGCLKYELVEKIDGELQTRLIEKEGPTGLIITTTRVSLHPENETRMMTLGVTDTPAQTRDILEAMTKEKTETVDFTPWCDFQDYLERLDNKVVIPFSSTLVSLLPSVKAVRFRRDFRQILSLIETHAILHQATRERDNQNRIVADIKDYAAVYALVADYIAHSVDACIPASVREAVEAVDALTRGTSAGVSFKAVGDYLNIDKSAAKRRCDRARFLGYLKNNEERKGKPAQLALDELMPDDTRILPSPEELDRAFKAEANGDCTVAA